MGAVARNIARIRVGRAKRPAADEATRDVVNLEYCELQFTLHDTVDLLFLR